jgi:hypothetical protein
MKRVAISAIALATSVLVSVANPGAADAFPPPPPCPDGVTFSFCIDHCPDLLYSECLSQAGHPVGCVTIDSVCDSSFWCDQTTQGQQKWLLECTYHT